MKSIKGFGLIVAVCLLMVAAQYQSRQQATFYLDSDFVGAPRNGTPSSPFCSWWEAVPYINAQRNAGVDVMLILSAREASSDTSDQYTGNSAGGCSGGGGSSGRLDLTVIRGTGRLAIDGSHWYNADDAAPSWKPYAGTSKASAFSLFAQNSGHMKINNVTVDGLKLVAQSEKALSICGDNWIVRNSDISSASGSTNGPAFLIVPTADGPHEGSSEWCPASTNILIENNQIHDSWGELLYVGGAGCIARDPLGTSPNCMGFPGHSNITIRNNKIWNGGVWGGEGDGIDLKAGLTNVTITGNEIWKTGSYARAIVTQGQAAAGPPQNYVVEGNNIHDCPTSDAAIALADTWGTPNGMSIKDNAVTASGVPVLVYAGTNIIVANNGPGSVPVPIPIPIPVPPTPIPVDTPPVPGAGGLISISDISSSQLMLNWSLATDDKPGLLYEVRRSASDNMTTVADAERNGTVIKAYAVLLSSFKVTGLKTAQVPYFVVIVADSAGQKAIYKTKDAHYSWH